MSEPFDPTPQSIPSPSSEHPVSVVPPAPDVADGEGVGSKPPHRRWVSLAVGLGLLVAMVAGGLVIVSNRSNSGGGGAVALAFAFDRGQTFRYHMDMSMDGTMDLGAAGGGEQPFTMNFGADVTWRVLSVDANGVATIDLTTENVTGTANGQPIPSSVGTAVHMRIARDGRILTGGELSTAAGGSSGLGFPGSDQVTPILPDHPVKPGDSWTKDFDQAFPFGGGRLHISSENHFDRYETLNGVKAAVISSHMTLPFDLDLDLVKLFDAIGQDSAALGLPEGASVTIHYGGSMSLDGTSWLDLAGKQLLKTQGTADFDMSVRFEGSAGSEELPVGEMGFTGKMGISMTQLH